MIISSEALNKYETKREARIGERYNKLTILSWLSRKDGYLVRCDCGNTLAAKYYRLVRGGTRSCRDCFISSASGRPILPNNLGAKRAIRTQYRLEAKRRGLEFNLDDSEFFSLIQKPCFYCGLPPSAKISITTSTAHDSYRYTGIDRVDSSLGYMSSNCVPCCKHCNTSKLDRNIDEWLQWVKQIYDYQKIRGTFND